MTAPERLTITLSGPQGCGKTQTKVWLERNLPFACNGTQYRTEDGRLVVDIVDGSESPRLRPGEPIVMFRQSGGQIMEALLQPEGKPASPSSMTLSQDTLQALHEAARGTALGGNHHGS